MKILEYRHNNACDTILMLESDGKCRGKIRSAWTVETIVMLEFCDCSMAPEEFDDQGGIDGHRPHDYGTLLAERIGHELHCHNAADFAERMKFFVGDWLVRPAAVTRS